MYRHCAVSQIVQPGFTESTVRQSCRVAFPISLLQSLAQKAKYVSAKRHNAEDSLYLEFFGWEKWQKTDHICQHALGYKHQKVKHIYWKKLSIGSIKLIINQNGSIYLLL